jgi:aminoglycoside phosphotransferase (APT) family kinase protein
MAETPAAEYAIDEALIRSLVRAQAPALVDGELRLVASGWDNEMWRLGDDHVVRVPRRALAVASIEHEQRWLPELAPHLPVPVPVPVVAGRATAAHPRPWNIVRWLPGAALADRPATATFATSLAAFLRALHRPAPPDAPVNDWRGVPLADRAERVEAAIGALNEREGAAFATAARARWDALVASPPYAGQPLWLHGDLHPLNLLEDDGALAAVIDFGDLTSGDPASDLAVAWMAFEAEERRRFQSLLPDVDTATWARAQGWALALGALVLQNTDDDPVLDAVGRVAVARVMADSVPGD